MSNIRNNQALIQAASPSLPALAEQCNKIDEFFKRLRALEAILHGARFKDPEGFTCRSEGRPWRPAELQEAKELLSKRPAMQELWSIVSQPASDDQIATLTAKLVASFPNLNNVEESNYFAEAMIEEIAAEGVSLYVLQRAMSAVRRKHQFLSIKAMVDEIERARDRAKWRHRRLHDDQLDSGISHKEERAKQGPTKPPQLRRQPRPPDLPPDWRVNPRGGFDDENERKL